MQQVINTGAYLPTKLYHITFQTTVIFRTDFILTWLEDKTIKSNGFQCNFRIASLYLSVPVLGVIQKKLVVSVGHSSETKNNTDNCLQ